MRIALFSEVYWPMVSGVGVTLVRLVDALQARGHEVRVVTSHGARPLLDREDFHGAMVYRFPFWEAVVRGDLVAVGKSLRGAHGTGEPTAEPARSERLQGRRQIDS